MIILNEKDLGQVAKEKWKREFKVYEHFREMNAVVKVICVAPMPSEDVRRVMIMRIWGMSPHLFAPMTSYQIAKQWIKESEGVDRIPTDNEIDAVVKIEGFGKNICSLFLRHVHAQEAIIKFNENFQQNFENMFARFKYEKKKFTV